jgi:3-deoxy-D-manno-octulosonic-acid transferase
VQFKIYQFLTRIGGPLIDLYLARRKMLGKEDEERFAERLGKASFPRPSGPLVWMHAASVGEAVSVLPLIKHVTDMDASLNVLLTTGTVTSARLIEKRLPKQAYHQYAPVDKVIAVRRFLKHWKPGLALWVESELWPNLIIETHKTGCAMLQVNACISPDSLEKWKKAGKLARQMLSCFSLSLVQTPEDGRRLEELGAKKTEYIGNLKFDAPALPADPKETGRLVSMIGERPMWLASSTHEGEEQVIAEVHKKLKEKHARLLTIIVPRHPERSAALAETIGAQYKLKVIRRSTGELIRDDTDVYLADTMGELGVFYRLTGIVLMGGSLVPQGGHNPLEAARLECAIITGPYVENFTRVYKEMAENGACIRLADQSQLLSELDQLLSDESLQEKYANAALELVESKSGVLEQYNKAIDPYLKTLLSNKS